MAARKVNTPGAAEKAPEPVSTAEQAEAALEHITGQDAEPQDQSTDALVPAEQFDAVAQKLAEAEEKIKALEAKSKASTKSAAPQALESKPAEVKHIHGVLTERGWDSAGG